MQYIQASGAFFGEDVFFFIRFVVKICAASVENVLLWFLAEVKRAAYVSFVR